MSETKTRATAADVAAFLDAATAGNDGRRRECDVLSTLLSRLTGCPPVMWGPSIVGFGQYHYRYDSGHEGDACMVGFSPRKGDFSIYASACFPEREAMLARLGKHKAGKACIYVKRLADIDMAALEDLMKLSIADTRKRYS